MDLDEVLRQMRDARREAVHLVGAGKTAGLSKIGGLPHLPGAIEWPAWDGEPLSFLAQIALDEMQVPSPLAGLPASGMLYFFYDREQSTWGFDPEDRGSWKVLHANAPSSVRRDAPAGMPHEGVYPEKPVRFVPIDSFPGWERLRVPADLPYAQASRLIEGAHEARTAAFAGMPRHQLGGYPDPEQGDEMELECQLASHGLYCGDGSGYKDPRAATLRAGASDWKLLLQLDTDDGAGVMWGDAGRLYFWIRSQDLAKGDFSNVWMVLQCG
jgi:uncharacterized protein YwqG